MTNLESVAQVTLGDAQIAAFNTDRNAAEQSARFVHFARRFSGVTPGRVVVDIGGGNGYFARDLNAATGWTVRVVDSDEKSIRGCLAIGVAGVHAVVFNLVLHHLVGRTESDTTVLQERSLAAWRERARFLMVSEISYDSFFFDITGKLIFLVTSSGLLSKVAAFVGRFVPSLRANTLGVGVRFRSKREWVSFFERCGYRVVEVVDGVPEALPFPLRFLFVKQIRSDYFLLVPK
jgi:hypothetical protein